MRGWGLRVALLIASFWQISLPAWPQPVVETKADVRVLIDVSGSMKQNDPKNLRRPALRLLVGLLPQDTRAGVWTFAQYVNMQIPLGQVDNAWKRSARESSKKIGSPGQFTHIEEALNRSTEDWSGPPTLFRRSLILLTDGMVDISPSKTINQASRQRILQQILPRLQQLGVAVHTIALSKNADHELLSELAKSSGGWYEQVEDSAQLQKVFLRIFEKVGKPDTLPLKDNRFTIDASVTEATVLVFRNPDARQTQLVPPDGEPFGMDDAPRSISWHRDEGYDMLTISDPQPGEWSIRAEVDPDNRVMVVTDLKMQTSELPNRLVQGQSLPFEVSFTDHGRLISRKDFLKLVTVKAIRRDEAGESEPNPLMDDGSGGDVKPGDGIFSMQFEGEDLKRGMGELVINAEGQTFAREKRLTYEVVPPVKVEVQPGEKGTLLNVFITPDEQLVDGVTLQTDVWWEDASGRQSPLALTQDANGVSQGTLDIMSFSGIRKLFIQAIGKTRTGESLEFLDSPLEVEGLMQPVVEKPVQTKPEPLPPAEEPHPEPVSESQPEDAGQLAEDASEQETPDEEEWLNTSLWFGGVNLLLLIGLGAGFWWLRRNSRKGLVILVEEEAPAIEEKAA